MGYSDIVHTNMFMTGSVLLPMTFPWWIMVYAVVAAGKCGGQLNEYPAKAHFGRGLSDLGSRKSSGRYSISETLGCLPTNDRQKVRGARSL
jgi:hypothetical protein